MKANDWRRVPGWDCRDGMPDEDHDWYLVPGDSSVGESDSMECRQCGKTRAPTEAEIAASYCDYDESEFGASDRMPQAG